MTWDLWISPDWREIARSIKTRPPICTTVVWGRLGLILPFSDQKVTSTNYFVRFSILGIKQSWDDVTTLLENNCRWHCQLKSYKIFLNHQYVNNIYFYCLLPTCTIQENSIKTLICFEQISILISFLKLLLSIFISFENFFFSFYFVVTMSDFSLYQKITNLHKQNKIYFT